MVLPVPLHAAAMPLTGCTVIKATIKGLDVAAMQKTCGVNTQRWMQTLEAMPRLQSALQELESEGVELEVKAIAAKAVGLSGDPQGFARRACLPANVSCCLFSAATTDICQACQMMLTLAMAV